MSRAIVSRSSAKEQFKTSNVIEVVTAGMEAFLLTIRKEPPPKQKVGEMITFLHLPDTLELSNHLVQKASDIAVEAFREEPSIFQKERLHLLLGMAFKRKPNWIERLLKLYVWSEIYTQRFLPVEVSFDLEKGLRVNFTSLIHEFSEAIAEIEEMIRASKPKKALRKKLTFHYAEGTCGALECIAQNVHPRDWFLEVEARLRGTTDRRNSV